MPSLEMVQNKLKFLDLMPPNVVGYILLDHTNSEVWKDILVLLNGNRKAITVNIPFGEWNVVCHDGKINLNGISQVSDTTFTIAPSSASILYVK